MPCVRISLQPMTHPPPQPDSRYAAVRLVVTLAIMTIGASGMYVVPVMLPAVQAEFGIARADASTPYSMLMIGFGVGGLLMGRLADRFGVMVPLLMGAVGLGLGMVLAGNAHDIGTFNLAHGVLIGLFGCSATFSPLLADTSLWFVKRRGIAVAICASGNYLGGAVWPPVVQHFVETVGWRETYIGMGIACSMAMLALALFMRRRPPLAAPAPLRSGGMPATAMPFGLTPLAAQGLFGLFQGGIVPSYAIIVREHFPASEAGARVGAVIMCTMLGMALGGWMSGKIFDLTGSYHAAFVNGIAWNVLNLTIATLLLRRVRRQQMSLQPA